MKSELRLLNDMETKPDPHWYCVRSKPKSEHLAASHLERTAGFEVFCPRIRFQKPTRRGKVWFVEALFPGYLFARFDLAANLRRVRATAAVSGVLHFSEFFPAIAADTIAEMRAEIGEDEPRTIEGEISEGDEVLITEGAMKGLSVLVTKRVPGRERVRILVEWLGQEREAEIALHSVASRGDARARLAGGDSGDGGAG